MTRRVDTLGLNDYIDNHSHLIEVPEPMNHPEAPARPLEPSRRDAPAVAAQPEISSLQLLGGHGQLRIAHQGAVYTLRATSKGGLILTK